jgi:predicted nucleic acid-binding protein
VVLAELWRDATESAEQEFLRVLEKNHRILAPTESNWLESGRLLGKIYEDKGFAPDKLRDLHFDVLIALTARSHGARLITSDRGDFELISAYWKFQMEILTAALVLRRSSAARDHGVIFVELATRFSCLLVTQH